MNKESITAGLEPSSRDPKSPEISVIIPVRNASLYLERCLEGVRNSLFQSYELIVVDDGSTDSTLEIADRSGAVRLTTGQPSGPAAARNLGVQHARGSVLLFVDADVVLPLDALEIVARAFRQDPNLAALFGSYDDAPPWTNVVSQYKNLLHHYIHQISNVDATTFWTGVGAIRKSVFVSVGGFNEKRYRRPSIEDVELGYRLRQAGHKVRLDKRLQGRHLKRWELRTLLDSDILCRAIPWSFLVLETKRLPKDLNFRFAHRASAVLVAVLALTAPGLFLLHKLYAVPISHVFIALWVAILGTVLFLNRHVYSFFARRRGLTFALKGACLHLFYYLYSGLVFGGCWVVFRSRVLTLNLLATVGLAGSRSGGGVLASKQ